MSTRAGTFERFAMAAQEAADKILATIQREEPEAATRVAAAIEAGASLSTALTIRSGSAWVELLLSAENGTHSIACVPLRVVVHSKVN